MYFIIFYFLVEHGFFYHINPHLEIVLQHNNIAVSDISNSARRNDQPVIKFSAPGNAIRSNVIWNNVIWNNAIWNNAIWNNAIWNIIVP